MNQNVKNGTIKLVDSLIEHKKSILITHSETTDTIEITVDTKAKILVESNRIMITAAITSNNLGLGLTKLSDDKRCRKIFRVTNNDDIAEAVDIIMKLD